jgi:hypothetical protein
MTLGRHKASGVPATTVAALDTVTINRFASQASRPIVMAQTSPPIANIVLSGRGGCQCTCLRPINVGQES